MNIKEQSTQPRDDDLEMNNLLHSNDLEQGSGAPRKSARGTQRPEEGIIQRLLLPLEERYSVKMLTRIWGPRFEFFVRLMLMASFLDDSVRTLMHFPELTEQVATLGILNKLPSSSLSTVLAAIFLGIGLLAQLVGSICLLSLKLPDAATQALIGWSIAQPVLYGQLTNIEYLSESLSLIGGLLMLRALLVYDQARHGTGARTQLLGRVLLPVMYVYYAGAFLLDDFTYDETSSVANFLGDLSIFFIYLAIIAGFAIGSFLVAVGLRSRLIAFTMAVLNLVFVCFKHPFFRYLGMEDGAWKVDVKIYDDIPGVARSEDVKDLDFDPWQIYDLHRYYFFLGLSTSGALLLLAQFGPGEIAVQKNEVLIPAVSRAID